MAIYVKSCFSVSILHAVTMSKCFEFIALNINSGSNNSIVVIGIYRPPLADAPSIDYPAELLSQYTNLEMIVPGDFNIDWLTVASDYLKEVSSSLNLSQLINEPTRPNQKNPLKSTLIDLILTKSLQVLCLT